MRMLDSVDTIYLGFNNYRQMFISYLIVVRYYSQMKKISKIPSFFKVNIYSLINGLFNEAISSCLNRATEHQYMDETVIIFNLSLILIGFGKHVIV